LSETIFEYRGETFDQPPTHIAARGPQGVPPIWIAGDSPELQKVAAERGYTPIFTGRMNDVDYLVDQRARCASVFAEAGRDPASLRYGALRFACITDSKAEAREFADHALFQNRLAANLRRRQEVMGDDGMMAEIPVEGEPSIDDIVDNLLIGDVETVIEKCVTLIRRARPVHIAAFFQCGGYPHAATMRSIERFAYEVIPGVEKELGPLDNFDPAAEEAA
jgi:alkanesulfonate monooxygenase SsuD/methylene tetrahydromethanopterin reductase-like flavin-dependent oxidoreductase (luciferase family)